MYICLPFELGPFSLMNKSQAFSAIFSKSTIALYLFIDNPNPTAYSRRGCN
jgi:hypothetical protein